MKRRGEVLQHLSFISILAMVFLSVSAGGAIITETEVFAGIPNLSTPLTFNQFDDLGGSLTLISVEVSLNLDVNGGTLIL